MTRLWVDDNDTEGLLLEILEATELAMDVVTREDVLPIVVVLIKEG